MRSDCISRFVSRLFQLVLAATLVACGGGGGGGDAGGTAPPPAATADVTVTVADTLGRFVAGAAVTVASTGASATTGAAGTTTLKVPVGSEQVLTVAGAGFAEQVRVLSLDAAATHGSLTTLVVAREPAVTLSAIEAGGTATGKHGVKIDFPAGALVDGAGRAVTGTIDLFMTPLDVSSSDVGAFPGLFEGTAAAVARSPIVSLGSSELVPQQGGQKLQLAAGKTATIELPLYVTTLVDGTPVRAGDTIPFWSLASATGLWTQEGSGTVVLSPASPTGLALRATIGHFSWWNTDQFAQRATVNVSVSAPGATVPAGTLAPVTAQVVAGTGPATTASTAVAVGGAAQAVTVAAPSTLAFRTSFDVDNLTCSGSATAAVTPGSTATAAIVATCVQVPTPTIVVPGALSSSNSTAPTRVQIVLDRPRVDSVELLADGVVVASFPQQLFYVHLLDTAGLPEGTTTLQARATVAGSTRSGNTVAVVIDRTPPQSTQVQPVATARVSRATTFTVGFDEPVNAVPFRLDDVVKLTVTPLGQATPVTVAADVRLDTAGLTLTVTPLADLPAGLAGLSWAGLHDAAGNAVTGTIAATWTVDQSSFVGPALSHASFANDYMGAALAIGADGSLIAAHKPVPGAFISLSRYDPVTNAWPVLVAAVNERPTENLLQMAVDGNGVLYIAFTQQTAADPAAFELVLKRLVGSTLELAAPIVALPGSAGQGISQGSMTIDASNRPVLTFTDPNGSSVRLFRLEQGVFVSLGVLATAADDPHLALQADGSILVAYTQHIGVFGLSSVEVVRIGTNGQVQPVGPAVDSGTLGLGQAHVLAVGSEVWAFYDKVDNDVPRTHAARFDGTQWIGVPFPTPITGRELDAAVLDGDPILVVSDGDERMQALRFRNGAWEPPFDATPSAGPGDRLQLAVRGSTALAISSQVNAPIAEVQRLLFP